MKVDVFGLVLGAAVAYPVVQLLVVIAPNMSGKVLIIAGLLFLTTGIYLKKTVGLFYRKVELDENPFGYWFNIGQAAGFVLLGLI